MIDGHLIDTTRSDAQHLRGAIGLNIEDLIDHELFDLPLNFLDELEDVAQNKALSGDTVMSLFLLKTIGKKRGYDQDRDVMAEGVTKGVLDFIVNRSKNPAES